MNSKFYTVTSVKPTGWEPDQYGNVTDSVFFQGETNSCLWRHASTTQVEKGTEVYGHIEEKPGSNGKPFYKFVKEMIPEGVDRPVSSSKGPTSSSNAGDGARQGMAINNAAMYVAAQAKESMLTPEEFAEEVTKYAKAIYKIDLHATDVDDEIMKFMSESPDGLAA